MKSIRKFGFFLLFYTIFYSAPSIASQDSTDVFDEAYLQIDSISFQEVHDDGFEFHAKDFSLDKSIDNVITGIDKIIAVGSKIKKIVEDGRPVVSSNFADTISILPDQNGRAPSIFEMEDWSRPTYRTYEVVYRNFYGMEVVRFKFTIAFQHDGSYMGRGRYIAGLEIVPNVVNVAWGYTFEADSELVVITNEGSSLDPLAAATIRLNYLIKTVLVDSRHSSSFHVTGDGSIFRY